MRNLAIFTIVLYWGFTGTCQDIAAVSPACPWPEMNWMLRNAHSREEFDMLSLCFERKEQEFRHKADTEKKELESSLAKPYLNSKYPTPADSARGLFQYYSLQADKFKRQAELNRLRATESNISHK